MIDAEAAVRALLLADATVAGLVGTRIYPDKMDQAPTTPAVVYQEISELADMSHDGPGLRKSRIQLDAYAMTRAEAIQTAEAIFEALCPRLAPGAVGFRRTVTLSDGSKVEVQGIVPDVRRSSYESDSKLYRRGRDYFVTAAAAA